MACIRRASKEEDSRLHVTCQLTIAVISSLDWDATDISTHPSQDLDMFLPLPTHFLEQAVSEGSKQA